MGLNSFGQLGYDGPNHFLMFLDEFIQLDLKNIKKISTGKSHTIATDSEDQLYGWGSNQ